MPCQIRCCDTANRSRSDRNLLSVLEIQTHLPMFPAGELVEAEHVHHGQSLRPLPNCWDRSAHALHYPRCHRHRELVGSEVRSYALMT